MKKWTLLVTHEKWGLKNLNLGNLLKIGNGKFHISSKDLSHMYQKKHQTQTFTLCTFRVMDHQSEKSCIKCLLSIVKSY